MKMLFIEGRRNGYDPSQCGCTMTVRDLAEFFEDIAAKYGNNIPVYISNDNGYTFGNIDEAYSFATEEDYEDIDDE